ncbi:cellulase family glycosylhydrolase [Streptomyces mobaraensis NBRC 13819 = DSM 40847]|uniref:cellulase family glycosylhydrolase n=1 Tax=Streptomyces mobaraensis TaxID=35621 RepID=UPI000684F29A|nr:cellulase family glycosylhydrolase [Streptomyces mobaraensis]QTT75672.1 cellulase family glycosylhydrolase [Streptomyces mobaraensis NBRC 13819 = DSM 40847]
MRTRRARRPGPVVASALALLTAVAPLATPTSRAEAAPAAPAIPAAPAAPGDGIPPLTDDTGRTLTLRGWNLADKDHRGDRALEDITERHLRDLSARGFDFARLAVFWDDLERRPGHYSERYLRKIERILDWAARYRVRVVIDAHQDVYGPAFGGHRGIPEWATRTDGLPYRPHPGDWFAEYFEPGVQAAFEHLYEDADLRRAQQRMWRVLAGRLAGHPAVYGYDLINEPMGRMRPGEDLPAAARRVEATQITAMYNRLVGAIRAVDRKHRILVEPTPVVGEGVPTSLGRIEDPGGRIVYAPHFYETSMETGADYDPASRWIERYEAAVVRYPRERRIPVVVGEWGPPDSTLPNMGRYYADALASLDRYGSGWAGWTWCYGGGYCALDRDGRFQRHKEDTARPYAPAVAGDVRHTAYDPRDGVFRLEYTASAAGGGRTDLTLPPAPRGWRVTVSGPARADAAYVRPGERGRVTVRARPGAAVGVVARQVHP